MSKGLKFIVLIFLFFGCKSEIIKYSYNGVTITRKDTDAKTVLSYGSDSIADNFNSKITIKYPGFNNGMYAYLVFHKNSKVELKKAGGGLYDVSNNRKKLLYMNDKETNVEFINWKDSAKYRFDSIIFISDVLEEEKQINLNNNTKVSVTYPTEGRRN